METAFDWISIIAFAGLITLFLQRSSAENPPDTIWQYLPPSICCAVANYLGNEGYSLAAIAILIAGAAFVVVVLKPFRKF